MLSTGVERVAIDFNTPQPALARSANASPRRGAIYAEDQFDKGSMGPKIQALCEYLEGGGKEGLITNPANIGRALAGETGTRVVPN